MTMNMSYALLVQDVAIHYYPQCGQVSLTQMVGSAYRSPHFHLDSGNYVGFLSLKNACCATSAALTVQKLLWIF